MPDPTNTLANDDSTKSAPEAGDPLDSGRSRGQVIDEAEGAPQGAKPDGNPDVAHRLQEDCGNDPHYASGRHDAAVPSARPA